MKKQGFQPTSSKLGGLKSQILSRGWPDHIKNEEAREQHFREQMQGRLEYITETETDIENAV